MDTCLGNEKFEDNCPFRLNVDMSLSI